MTARAYLLIFLSFGLLFMGVAMRSGSVIVLAVPLIVYLGMAALNRPEKIELEGQRSLDREKILPGLPVEMRVKVGNLGQPAEELDIEDHLPHGLALQDGELTCLTALQPGEEIDLTTTLSGLRGDYIFGGMSAHVCETFGLFDLTETFTAAGNLVIHPAPMRLKPLPIRPPQTKGFAGPIPSRQGGAGVDFLIVREYQPGDPLRQINWKISARHESAMYTTIYEQQRIADIGIILDSRMQCDIHSGDEQLFENSVRAAGALAELFLDDGNRVGMLVYGATLSIAFPGMGKIQRERILQTLSRAQTGFSYALEKLDYIPTRFFPPRSQIILISPLTNDDVPVLGFLSAQGYSVLVISPNPIVFEAGAQPNTSSQEIARACAETERLYMFNALRRFGVQVVDWNITQPLEPLVRAAVSSNRRMGAVIS
jgi:uncharacterized protein (DUF58 family)